MALLGLLGSNNEQRPPSTHLLNLTIYISTHSCKTMLSALKKSGSFIKYLVVIYVLQFFFCVELVYNIA